MNDDYGTAHDDTAPHGDYLWDRSGPQDAEVARLERLLAPCGLRVERVEFSRRESSLLQRMRVARPRRRIWLAIAAGLALAMIGAGGWYRFRLQWPDSQPWNLVVVGGVAQVDGMRVQGASRLAPGDVLDTGEGAPVRLDVARIGEVVVGENSRLRLVETRGGRHRVQLERGSLWAKVWAPPGTFGVGTRGALVSDLGCEFVLQSDARGHGQLTVLSGWVQIDNGRWETLVPQGARVELRGAERPAIPQDLGASAAFVASLREIDAQGSSVAVDGAVMRRLLAAARPRDAISLLSLLKRHPRLGEGPLFDHLARNLPANGRVTREALRTHGVDALDPWWDALPYPRLKHWWLNWSDAFGSGDTPQGYIDAATN